MSGTFFLERADISLSRSPYRPRRGVREWWASSYCVRHLLPVLGRGLSNLGLEGELRDSSRYGYGMLGYCRRNLERRTSDP